MSVGQPFTAVDAGTCAACSQGYQKGAQLRWWDEAKCHADCVDPSGQSETTVLVVRGAEGHPIAVPEEVVIANERPWRAYKLHEAGHSWEVIADQENYANWKAARADVRRYLDEGASVIRDFTRQQLVDIELARLAAYQQALWEMSMKGNIAAINTSLSISTVRIKLLRLDKDIRDDDGMSDGSTVVIGSDDEDYTSDLETASSDRGHHGG